MFVESQLKLIRLEVKYGICTATIFFKVSRIYSLNGAGVARTSEVRIATMLLLCVVTLKLRTWYGLHWHDVCTKFNENPSNVSEVIRKDMQV